MARSSSEGGIIDAIDDVPNSDARERVGTLFKFNRLLFQLQKKPKREMNNRVRLELPKSLGERKGASCKE